MKNFTLLLFMLLTIFGFAQQSLSQTEKNFDLDREAITLFDYRNTFEEEVLYQSCHGTFYNPEGILELNTLGLDSLWSVGIVNKGEWDTTFLKPNHRPYSLATDTINPYPINQHAVFEIDVQKPDWAIEENNCWSYFVFQMDFACNTDTLKDGMYIEISFDGGEHFVNALDMDAVLNTNNAPDNILNIAAAQSSFVQDNILGYSGIVREDYGGNNMETFEIDLEWNNEHGFEVKHAKIRVHFVSDSIDTQKNGIIINDLWIQVDDFCFSNVNQTRLENTFTYAFPNPVQSKSKIVFPNPKHKTATVYIYSPLGKLVNTINTQNDCININANTYSKGVYTFKVHCNNHINSGKFVVL